MVELKKNLKRRGIELTQLFKDNELVIYEAKQGNDYWYEIFKLTVEKPNNIVNDDWERYPSISDFGKWAWSCADENCVAKVLHNHFPTHPMTSAAMEYTDGKYAVNGESKPHFKINKLELHRIMSGFVER